MAIRTISGHCAFSAKGRSEMYQSHKKETPYHNPKNEFERKINKLNEKQSIGGYRLKILSRNGFISKMRESDGKIILRLIAAEIQND